MSDSGANLVSIGGQKIDIADPCQLCRALQAYRVVMATGGAVEEFEIRSPVTNRRTKFGAGSKLADLDVMIEKARADCAELLGETPKRRRFAISGGFRPY